jgi:long-chain fatty acid transport protein
MKRNLLCALALGLALVLGATSASAAGYELQEQSAVAQGRGLAVNARLEDPSTLFLNPGGLGYLDGLNVSAGMTVLLTTMRYTDPTGVRPGADVEKVPPNTPAHVYATWSPLDGLTIGAGLTYAPWGQKFKWPKGFTGESMLSEADLRIPLVLAGVGWRPWKWLSIGAALQYAPSTIDMKQRFAAVDDAGNPQTITAEFAGTAHAVGGLFGLQARPIEGLYLGASYRSRLQADFTGHAHFTLPDTLTDRSLFHDQRVKTAMTTPDVIGVGVGYDILPWLYTEYDMNLTLWQVNESLDVSFPDDASGMLSTSNPNHWKNTLTYRLSFQFSYVENLILRMGGGFDDNPVPDGTLSPTLPDCDRIFAGLGAQYFFPSIGLNVALAWQGTHFVPRSVYPEDQPTIKNALPQRYTNFAQLISLTLGYTLDI